ncbi:hypothetical protein GCM10011402_34950 [Paracoccus acridae]|uniref:Short chain dehydrogenase-like proteobacteria domain-containing protein n=1 Tax=Paracoccus acridae TaxID=1795310 RepID=A0ABQ1VLQ1_9RHOB|nr:SDR family oxidoreductase [Paracoccus acridae]GGF79307.1 hypothetical protein GCM10011402_34950 [Paracoccus acridae]
MNKVVITGAASGIGRETARIFADAGWTCVLLDLDGEGLAAVRADLPGGSHQAVAMDLTRDADYAALAAIEGPVAAVICNAGASGTPGRGIADLTPGELDAALALNQQAPLRMLAALEGRLAHGARVVAVSSGAGLRAIPLRGGYSPSKAGLIAAMMALSDARTDLAVSVLCPGFIRTALVDRLIAGGQLDPARAVAKIPLGRMGTPQEMADALFFLAAPADPPLRGCVLSVDGGSSVFGGSVAYAPGPDTSGQLAPDAGFALRHADDLSSAFPPGATPQAVADGRARHAPDPMQALRAAAADFAATEGAVSLTLLLPADDDPHPAARGQAATLRMMVATLACELGPQGRRVNAVQGRPDPVLIDWIARAGFLTGQVLTSARSAP